MANNLKDLNEHLMTSSYIGGHFSPTLLDSQVLASLSNCQSDLSKYIHLSRWLRHIQSFDAVERSKFDSTPTLQLDQPQDLKSRVRKECVCVFCLISTHVISTYYRKLRSYITYLYN